MIKSLYIHIPFCDAICGYCDFVRVGYNKSLVDRYLVELRKDLLELDQQFETIYIGGGTPSSLDVNQTQYLLESLSHLKSSVKEFTIEINPESLTLEKAKHYQNYGINRASLGVQTTCDKRLKEIDRLHTYDDVKKSINILRDVEINNFSCDLIYGLPKQKLEDVKTDIDNLLQLDPPHLSLYSLTIEPHSKFGRLNIKPVSNDLETQMYLLIQEKLNKNNYFHYEISNYCKSGYESSHNLSYWHYDDFLGVGIGASSKVGHKRFTVSPNLNDYLNGIREYSEMIELEKTDEMFEYVMMNSRLSQGIDLDDFKNRFNVSFEDMYLNKLQEFIDKGLIKLNKKRLIVENDGRLMLNDILVELL